MSGITVFSSSRMSEVNDADRIRRNILVIVVILRTRVIGFVYKLTTISKEFCMWWLTFITIYLFFGEITGIDRPIKCPEEYSYCKFSTFFNEGDVYKKSKFNSNRKILR